MFQIRPTATVDPGTMIGDFTSVWHYCHVKAKAIVGENCNLGQNVYIGIGNNAVAGHACRLGNSVGIFSHVKLGNFVFCAPFMVFTLIAFPRAAVSRRANFIKSRVGTGSTLGADSNSDISIGMGTFWAAGSSLTRSTKDWAFMVDVPARHLGGGSAYGGKIPLPVEGCA